MKRVFAVVWIICLAVGCIGFAFADTTTVDTGETGTTTEITETVDDGSTTTETVTLETVHEDVVACYQMLAYVVVILGGMALVIFGKLVYTLISGMF